MARPFFISYRHQEPDQRIAQALAQGLEADGHRVFLDVAAIRWGDDWAKTIRDGIASSDFLILLLSRAAADSEMVVEEVAIAKDLARMGKRSPALLPVRVQLPFDEALPYHLSAYLRTIQQEIWEKDEDTARLVGELRRIGSGDSSWQTGQAESLFASPPVTPSPPPQVDPRTAARPGGALDVAAGHYIIRQTDTDVLSAVREERAVITVRGARQIGKTSLLLRICAAHPWDATALRAAFIDFQAFDTAELTSLDALFCGLCERIATELHLDRWTTRSWEPDLGHERNFLQFLDRFVFDGSDTPILLCFDEVDHLFETPAKSFFPVVRSFYNRGARDATLRRIRWLLSTSSEPAFFIRNLSQSPFNISDPIELVAFNEAEVAEFASRQDSRLEKPAIAELLRFTGGRPFLVHKILYEIAHSRATLRGIIDSVSTGGGGLFRDHLNRYLVRFQSDLALKAEMVAVLRDQGSSDAALADRLLASGLVRLDAHGRLVPFNELYARYFSDQFKVRS